MDIVERLRNYDHDFDGKLPALGEAADEIERLRKVNVMQARWLHEAHENHKLFKDKVRLLLNGADASVALKDGE